MQREICPPCQLMGPLDLNITSSSRAPMGFASGVRTPGEFAPRRRMVQRIARSIGLSGRLDDCPHGYPDQGGDHELHCLHSPGGGAS
jgi:hypothetical protein